MCGTGVRRVRKGSDGVRRALQGSSKCKSEVKASEVIPLSGRTAGSDVACVPTGSVPAAIYLGKLSHTTGV